MTMPGRNCPLRYRYGAAAIAAAPVHAADTVYVIGGLYGNLPALATIEALAAAEAGPVRLVFNGDFNWFDVDDRSFRILNARVLRHHALLGNVEAELAPDADDAGCGCAYPDAVGADTVARSNLIHARLKATAARHPDLLARLCALPMFARYRVGDLRVGIVHGDAESLAGWRFAADTPDSAGERRWFATACAEAGVDLFASSHTCLPALRRAPDIARPCYLINNGAAGMPNFSGLRCGVISRIATTASPHAPLYGLRLAGAHIDALAVPYDEGAWEAAFLANWPPGSPAWQSYYRRMTEGPDWDIARATGAGRG